VTRLNLRNGAYTAYEYDQAVRLTKLRNFHNSGYLENSFAYEYDLNSNITRIATDMAGLPIVTAYAYDTLNRLTREATCDYMDEYTFDGAGNRTQVVRHEGYEGGGGFVPAPDPANTKVITKTYQYDAAYRLTKDVWSGAENRTKVYYWDAGGRLTRQEADTTGTDTDYNYYWDALDRMTYAQTIIGGVTKTIRYDYNASGLRTQRVVTSEQNRVTKFWTYQGVNIASVQETTPGGGIDPTKDRVYTVAPGQINNALERHRPDYTAGTTDSQYYQYDHRGNVVGVTDAAGDLLHTYHYDAYGRVVHRITAGATQAAPTTDLLFTGKDLDPDTGLYYFNARWYDAEVGRFPRRADLRSNQEQPYEFSGNNPMNRVDPSGHMSYESAWAYCTFGHTLARAVEEDRKAKGGGLYGCASVAIAKCNYIQSCMADYGHSCNTRLRHEIYTPRVPRFVPIFGEFRVEHFHCEVSCGDDGEWHTIGDHMPRSPIYITEPMRPQ